MFLNILQIYSNTVCPCRVPWPTLWEKCVPQASWVFHVCGRKCKKQWRTLEQNLLSWRRKLQIGPRVLDFRPAIMQWISMFWHLLLPTRDIGIFYRMLGDVILWSPVIPQCPGASCWLIAWSLRGYMQLLGWIAAGFALLGQPQSLRTHWNTLWVWTSPFMSCMAWVRVQALTPCPHLTAFTLWGLSLNLLPVEALDNFLFMFM